MIAIDHVTSSRHSRLKIGAPGEREARVSTSRPSHVAKMAVIP